jgi:hypothetical protein
LIIDNTDVYHLGASLKDLGRRTRGEPVEPWFAFSKIDKSSVGNMMNLILELL